MPSKDDAPAGSSEVGEMARRFLRGDLTLEDAALGIAEHVPRDGVWGLLWDMDTSPEDAARLHQLFLRVVQLTNPRLDEDPD